VRHTVSSRRETLIIVDKLRHSANVFKPTSFFVGQRHNNSIANATDEFKRVLFIAGDFVDVMPERGDYVDRVVVASPVHRHVFIVVLFTEHALYRLFVKSIRIHSGRALKLVTFFVGQFDDDRRILVVVAKELGRVVVGIAEDVMGEPYTIAPHDDGFAVIGPADINGVR
jgi:hypothetical protein